MATQTQLRPKIIITANLQKPKRDNHGNFTRSLRRSRIELIAEILNFCSSKCQTKTRIMYCMNLNYLQIQNYLSLLERTKMLHREKNRYLTNEKGHYFLRLYNEIQSALEE